MHGPQEVMRCGGGGAGAGRSTPGHTGVPDSGHKVCLGSRKDIFLIMHKKITEKERRARNSDRWINVVSVRHIQHIFSD